LRPGDVAFVAAFQDRLWTLAQPTDDLKQLDAALRGIPGTERGSTALFDALCSVHLSDPPSTGESFLVVVGDFEDNSSHFSEEQMLRRIHKSSIRIFPLLRLAEPEKGRRTRQARQVAKRVSESTGGEVLNVENRKELLLAFSRLQAALAGAYQLTYEPLPGGQSDAKIELRTRRSHISLLVAP